MKNDYLTFAINEIKIALNDNNEELYIGYNDFAEKEIGFNISINAWDEYMEILKEYAIDEECYEYCEEITELQKEVKKYVKNFKEIKS